MAVKILLADKSITIQKVVEMLFSGKEYEVVCVSDGETALSEAGRVVPDVVLADVDLPRVDGYSFSTKMKRTAALAQTPVILMLSRDDVFDEAKARQVGIIDNIVKPFESQELIGKVKKAITAAPPRLGEPSPAARPAAAPTPPMPAAAAVKPPMPAAAPAAAAKPAVPSDIFDIIKEAPYQAGVKQPAPAPKEETVFEVEPELEVEAPLTKEVERALPVGKKAVEEMRAGLGIGEEPAKERPEIVDFEKLSRQAEAARGYAPPPKTKPEPRTQPFPEAEEFVPREYKPPAPQAPAREAAAQTAAVSEDMLRGIAEETVARIAREVLEKVAWEIIPDLAERLIREEIEKLKAGT